MKTVVERTFYNLNHEYLGWTYQKFESILNDLMYAMRDKIGFIEEGYRNLRFVMNVPFYNEFYKICKMLDYDSNIYRGIKIYEDPSLYIGDTKLPTGIVRLEYEGDICREGYYKFWADELIVLDRGHGFQKVPHIDHVKFNGPATIVFWKDGTKTVVKYDGEGFKDYRKAILYAFMRKIYGEGKPYHNILNEIEEVMKQELWMPLPEKGDIK